LGGANTAAATMVALGYSFYFSRWVGLVAGVYLMTLSGSIYMFAVYSGRLKEIFHYSTEELNLIGALANTGGWLTFMGGIWVDHFGPRSTCFLGGLMNFTGYFLVYLAANKYFPTTNIVVGLFAAIMAQGGGWIYGAVLKVVTKNFRVEDRGKVVGAMVCFYGLSSGVLTQIYKGFYSPDVIAFLLFLAILLGSGGVIIGMFLNTVAMPFSLEEEDKMGRIKLITLIAIVLAVFNGSASIITGLTDITSLPFAIFMLAILATILLLPINTGPPFSIQPIKKKEHSCINQDENDEKAFTSEDKEGKDEVAQTGEELSLLQSLGRLDFWLLSLIFFSVIGSGISLVNNFGELVFSIANVNQSVVHKSEDVPNFEAINILVSLFSSFNTLGRVGVGFISDYITNRWGISARISLLLVASILMMLVQAYYSLVTDVIPMLYPGVIFLGISYGATYATVPTLTLEYFGYKNFATCFGLMGLAPALGSVLLATLLAGKLNDYFRKDGEFFTEDEQGNKTSHCNNANCFRYTFFITAFLCLLSVGLALWLWKRRWDAWKRREKRFGFSDRSTMYVDN